MIPTGPAGPVAARTDSELAASANGSFCMATASNLRLSGRGNFVNSAGQRVAAARRRTRNYDPNDSIQVMPVMLVTGHGATGTVRP
jgi:hypothetical protein